MSSNIKVNMLSGYRLTQEVFNALGDLPLDFQLRIISLLYTGLNGGFASYGVVVDGRDSAFAQSYLKPSVSGSEIIVNPGIAIFKDGSIGIVTSQLSIEKPPEDNYIYLDYDIIDDTSNAVHDVEGTVDYPIKQISPKIVLSSAAPGEGGGGSKAILLGKYIASTDTVVFQEGSSICRDIAVLVGGLIWPGDADSVVTDRLVLTPSVEPGVSLWRFLACKGSGTRTVNNPFGLTFDDIQGEINYIYQSSVLLPGIVTNIKGIYSNIYVEFQDKRYPPLYAKAKSSAGVESIIFNVSDEGGGKYVVSDIYSPYDEDPATEKEGYLLIEGVWYKYISDAEFVMSGQPEGYYIVYLQADSANNRAELVLEKRADINDCYDYVNTLYKDNKLPLVVFSWLNGSITILKQYLYSFGVYNPEYIKIEGKNDRFPSKDEGDFVVDSHTNEKYDNFSVDNLLNYEFVRRRGVARKSGVADYETLKGTFIFYGATAVLNLDTGQFEPSDSYYISISNGRTITVAGSVGEYLELFYNKIEFGYSPGGGGSYTVAWSSAKFVFSVPGTYSGIDFIEYDKTQNKLYLGQDADYSGNRATVVLRNGVSIKGKVKYLPKINSYAIYDNEGSGYDVGGANHLSVSAVGDRYVLLAGIKGGDTPELHVTKFDSNNNSFSSLLSVSPIDSSDAQVDVDSDSSVGKALVAWHCNDVNGNLLRLKSYTASGSDSDNISVGGDGLKGVRGSIRVKYIGDDKFWVMFAGVEPASGDGDWITFAKLRVTILEVTVASDGTISWSSKYNNVFSRKKASLFTTKDIESIDIAMLLMEEADMLLVGISDYVRFIQDTESLSILYEGIVAIKDLDSTPVAIGDDLYMLSSVEDISVSSVLIDLVPLNGVGSQDLVLVNHRVYEYSGDKYGKAIIRPYPELDVLEIIDTGVAGNLYHGKNYAKYNFKNLDGYVLADKQGWFAIYPADGLAFPYYIGRLPGSVKQVSSTVGTAFLNDKVYIFYVPSTDETKIAYVIEDIAWEE